MGLIGCLARIHACFLAGFEQAAAFVLQLAALVFQVAHQTDRFVQPGTRLAGLALQFVELGGQLAQFAVDLLGAGAGGFQLAAMALQLAGQFGLAPVRVVQLALRVVARALGLELVGAQGVEPLAGFFQLRFQRGDLLGQRAQLALARQHADLTALCAAHARPARAQPFAAARHHRLVRRQCRQRADLPVRVGQRFGGQHVAENGQRRRRATHVRRQRAGGAGSSVGSIEQGDVGVVDALKLGGQRV